MALDDIEIKKKSLPITKGGKIRIIRDVLDKVGQKTLEKDKVDQIDEKS